MSTRVTATDPEPAPTRRSGGERSTGFEILSPEARRIIALLARRWSLPILAALNDPRFNAH